MRSLRDIFAKLPADGQIRHELRRFNLSPAVDRKAKSVKDLAISLGFNVDRRLDLPKGMNGRLVKDAFSENGYCVEVNGRLSVEAQRWAVLHELGHFYLHAEHEDFLDEIRHYDPSEFNTFYRSDQKKEEREANQFAEVLLFGDGALEAANTLYRGNLERMCHHFGVTENVLRIAMKRFLQR